MSVTPRRVFPLLLVTCLLLGACAPLVSGSNDRDREHLAALKEQLQQLQTQLTELQAAQTKEERGWQPLLADSTTPAGHAGYSYLLYAGTQSPEGLKHLASLLDPVGAAPPGQGDDANLLMLVPLQADAPRPTIDNYDFPAARRLLASAGLSSPPTAGPLLLTTSRPLGGSVQPGLLLVPAVTSPAALKALLAPYRQPAAAGNTLARLCWQLLESAPAGSLSAGRQGQVVVLQQP